jgi:hypothetical protein
VILIAVALLSGVVNSTLRSYEAVADPVGRPRLVAFLTQPSHPMGWQSYKVAQFEWARQFFGADSTWYRYDYHWNGQSPTPFPTSQTVSADVISTSDESTFSAHGIESCYNLHGYTLQSASRVDLGGGVVGHVLEYRTDRHTEWTDVYWINPVHTAAGTRYERVNLMLVDAPRLPFTTRVPGLSHGDSLGAQIEGLLTGTSDAASGPKLSRNRAFLAAFAADLLRHQQLTSTTHQ